MLLGSSQTWGEGALGEEDVVDKIIESNLNESLSNGKRYECINAGIRGESSSGLFDLYEKEFIKLNPRILLINLSNNDSPVFPEKFAENLNKFIKLNDRNGIETVLILEANSPEHRDRLFLNSIMSEVAKVNNKLSIDMNSYLRSQVESGFIWWDNVHMTSFGQELFAEEVVRELRKIIE